MSYEDVCAIAWKGYKAGAGAGWDRMDREHGIVVKNEWQRDDGGKKGGKKGSKGSKPDWHR